MRKWAILPLAVICGIFSPALLAETLFPNPVFQVGKNPSGLAVRDFDGDGIQDLVSSNFGDAELEPGTLSFLKGLGDGRFAEQVLIPTLLPNPTSVDAADFNGDARPDLIIRYSAGLATISLGQAGGLFGPEQVLESSVPVASLNVGDFNGDGRLDIQVWGRLGTIGEMFQFQVLFGNGDGTFAPAPPVDAPALQWVDSEDFNEDGRDDLVVADVSQAGNNLANRILLLTSAGDGTFQEHANFTTGEYTWIIHPADLNGDGHVDLGIGTTHLGAPGPSFIFFGRGDGTFDSGPIDLLARIPVDLVAGDFNRDGIQDFANLDYGFDEIQVRLGVGDGTFREQTTMSAGVDNVKIVAGDFDRDGVGDLAVLANRSEAVFTFAGNGDGTFGTPPIPALTEVFFAALAAGDFNADTRTDLVVPVLERNEIWILGGQGDGTFGSVSRAAVAPGPWALADGDFDRNGTRDLAVVSIDSNTLTIFLGGGDLTLSPAGTYETGPGPVALAVSDLNRDGAVDIVSVGGGEGDVFLGWGDGTFLRASSFLSGDLASGMAVGDFNGDGVPDVAVANRGYVLEEPPFPYVEGDVSLLIGNGDGSFQPRAVLASFFSASAVASSDLNSDGILDLVVADEGNLLSTMPGGVTVLIGDGRGAFTAGSPMAAGFGPQIVEIADYDVDGRRDLAVPSNSSDVSIFLGRGDGSFAPPSRHGGGFLLTSGDFNSDQKPDLVMSLAFGATILLNRGGSARTLVLDLSLSLSIGPGGRMARVSWRTDQEREIQGFNVVAIIRSGGRIQFNNDLLACHECTTGRGSEYFFDIRRPRSSRRVFVEVVYLDGRVERFGPASGR